MFQERLPVKWCVLFFRAGRDAILFAVRDELSNQVGKGRSRTRYTLPKGNQKVLRFCPHRDFNVNKGALFMQPHRLLPRHFEIHPEFHPIKSK